MENRIYKEGDLFFSHTHNEVRKMIANDHAIMIASKTNNEIKPHNFKFFKMPKISLYIPL